MSRGLPDAMRQRYFKESGSVWAIDPAIQKTVLFSRFNLQDNPASLGMFDIIFLRYVAIYFNDDFRRQLLAKAAQVLSPGGCLLLGAVENVRGYSTAFETHVHAGGSYYRLACGEEAPCQRFSVSTTHA